MTLANWVLDETSFDYPRWVLDERYYRMPFGYAGQIDTPNYNFYGSIETTNHVAIKRGPVVESGYITYDYGGSFRELQRYTVGACTNVNTYRSVNLENERTTVSAIDLPEDFALAAELDELVSPLQMMGSYSSKGGVYVDRSEDGIDALGVSRRAAENSYSTSAQFVVGPDENTTAYGIVSTLTFSSSSEINVDGARLYVEYVTEPWPSEVRRQVVALVTGPQDPGGRWPWSVTFTGLLGVKALGRAVVPDGFYPDGDYQIATIPAGENYLQTSATPITDYRFVRHWAACRCSLVGGEQIQGHRWDGRPST